MGSDRVEIYAPLVSHVRYWTLDTDVKLFGLVFKLRGLGGGLEYCLPSGETISPLTLPGPVQMVNRYNFSPGCSARSLHWVERRGGVRQGCKAVYPPTDRFAIKDAGLFVIANCTESAGVLKTKKRRKAS